MSTKKTKTINRLQKDGHTEIAARVESWRSTKGNNWGWDSWFASQFPKLAIKYDVAQGHKSGTGPIVSKTKHTNKGEATEAPVNHRNASAYDNHENKSTDDALDFIANQASRNTQRQFDVYCFADYRGDRNDGTGGIAVALGIPDHPIIHIEDVCSRRDLSEFWLKLLSQLKHTEAKLIFGQDHQYGVPAGLLNELGIRGSWRKAMEAVFCEKRFGNHAERGEAGRFAAAFNRVLVEEGKTKYFYSHTKSEIYGIPQISPRRDDPDAYRLVERLGNRRPFPFARVGDNGSVGGQSIVGIPKIMALLESEEGQSVFAWPFDGPDLSDSKQHVLVEVYPSLIRPDSVPQSDVNDAIACVEWCMEKDAEGQLRNHFSSEAIPDYETKEEIVNLEGWYLGVTEPPA